MSVAVRRVYETPGKDDGYRLLIDRVWPRGLRKEDAALDEWARDIAPSTELRRWYGHDPERFEAFCDRYEAELSRQPDRVATLRARARRGRVTLLTASRDVDISNATVLARMLRRSR